jgi:hypothetical protein
VSVVQYPAPTVCSYYCRMDFFSQIGEDSPCLSQRRNSLGRFIEISELAGPQISQDKRGQLSLLLETAVDANEHSKSSFIDACGELVSNIRHAYNVSVDPDVFSRPRAYIGAQYYPNKAEIEFCICDSGVGIKASLEATDETGIRSDLEAIDIALARGNRNTNVPGVGIGLASLKSYVRKNKGLFVIRSGSALKRLRPQGPSSTENLPVWPGTIITLKIDVKRDTDLSIVWDRMAGHDN